MKKYRLNIPEMIKKEQSSIFIRLEEYFIDDVISGKKSIESPLAFIPKDWLEEIKEQVVVDPEKYADDMFLEYMETTDSKKLWFAEIAKKMNQNGRLERDLELRLFIEAVMKHIPKNENIIHAELLKQYRNLKPL